MTTEGRASRIALAATAISSASTPVVLEAGATRADDAYNYTDWNERGERQQETRPIFEIPMVKVEWESAEKLLWEAMEQKLLSSLS